MTDITRVAAQTVQAYATRRGASSPKPAQARPETAPAVDQALARVDLVNSQTSYTASLNALRKANKTMMGYLLNVKV
jgi:hypothetical protein